ncbi:hypothetical protein CPC08DRAFT_761826 [Agrocybe pediades]|nr:hypothetical protein CPC08DRAFT_761826 [Agrocybe pediades]
MTCSSITAPALSFDVTPPIPVPSTARSLRAQSSASLLKLGGSSSSSTARRSSKGKKKADSEELGPERSDNLGISLGLTPFMAHQDYMFNQNRSLVANEALMADAVYDLRMALNKSEADRAASDAHVLRVLKEHRNFPRQDVSRSKFFRH